MKGVVTKDKEMIRILSLPKKDLNEIVPDYTEDYKVKGGDWSFNKDQNQFIHDLKNNKGPFADIPVGGGKSLCSLIAGTVTGSVRPLLLVPASLRDQTNKHVIPLLRTKFRIAENTKVMSYTELSLAKNQNFLNEYCPDLIICDEAHKLKDVKATRVKRFKRYLQRNPSTRITLMSGSFFRSGIRDMSHLCAWTHREMSPLPTTWKSMDMWSAALDTGLPWHLKAKTGALRYLTEDLKIAESMKIMTNDETQVICRKAVQKRMYDTPGFIKSKNQGLGIGLTVKEAKFSKMTKEIKKHIDKIEKEWVSPSGKELLLASEKAMIVKQLMQGYYTYWEKEAPESWMEARREFNSLCNRVTKGSHTVDSESLFKIAYKDHETVVKWKKEKSKFRPKSKAKWVDDSFVLRVKKWIKKDSSRQIIWVSSPHIGAKIEEKLGIKYFGSGSGAAILDHTEVCCASIKSFGTGYNLQHFNNALCLMPLHSGDTMEQLIGRHYRMGQLAEEVRIEIWIKGNKITEGIHEKCKESISLIAQLSGKQQLYQKATKIA